MAVNYSDITWTTSPTFAEYYGESLSGWKAGNYLPGGSIIITDQAVGKAYDGSTDTVHQSATQNGYYAGASIPATAIRACLYFQNPNDTAFGSYGTYNGEAYFREQKTLNLRLAYIDSTGSVTTIIMPALTQVISTGDSYSDNYGINYANIFSSHKKGFGKISENTWVWSSNIFTLSNLTAAQHYLETGENPYPEEETTTKEWILHEKIYRTSSATGVNGTLVDDVKYTIVENGENTGDIYAYLNNLGTLSGLDNLCDIDIYSDITTTSVTRELNGETTTYTSVSDIPAPIAKWTTPVYSDGYYYYGQILEDTNIPIYASLNEGAEGGTPIYDNGGGGDGSSNIGDDDAETDMNETSQNIPAMSRVYTMEKTSLQEISTVLYTSDTGTWESIADGLKLYGENPANFIIHAFYIPIDPSPFITTAATNQIPFGSYIHTLTNSINAVSSNYTLREMASLKISGAYNDYRDYEANYYIYLPFVGISSIDIEKYMYQTMTIKAFMDIRTGNIKYFIFASNRLVDTFEGSICVSIPISSADRVAQATNYVNGAQSVYNGATSIGKGLANANPITAVGGMATTFGGVAKMTQGAPKSIHGSVSPATGIKDPLYPYLIIESNDYFGASGIRSAYNKPDNQWREIGALSGYAQFADVRLNVAAHEDELSEIESLLKGGVII